MRRLVETTSQSELVVADRPIVAYLADRRLPGPLVDTAHLRFATGSLTTAVVLDEIERHRIRAVVAGREFRNHADLVNVLEQRFTLERFEAVRFYLRR